MNRLGVRRLAELGVVLGPVGLEVGRQVEVGVTPFLGAATQISLHRSFSRSAWNTRNSYTVRRIRWRRSLDDPRAVPLLLREAPRVGGMATVAVGSFSV